MSNIDPILVSIITNAVNFLFDEASKIFQERRTKRIIESQAIKKDFEPPTNKSEILALTPNKDLIGDAAEEIQHYLSQIRLSRENKRKLEKQITLYGGLNYSPIYLQNLLESTENDIENWCNKLREIIERVYGHKINTQQFM